MSIGAPASWNYPPFQGTVPDSDAGTVTNCPGATRLLLQISNQGVYITFGHGQAGAIQWEPYSEPFLPVVGQVSRSFDAFKVRAMTPAAQLPAGAVQASAILTAR